MSTTMLRRGRRFPSSPPDPVWFPWEPLYRIVPSLGLDGKVRISRDGSRAEGFVTPPWSSEYLPFSSSYSSFVDIESAARAALARHERKQGSSTARERSRGDLFFPDNGDEPEPNESDEEFYRNALERHADDFFRMPGVAFQRGLASGSEDWRISRGALWEIYALLVAFDTAGVRVPKLTSWNAELGQAGDFLDSAEPRVMEAIKRMSAQELSDALGHYNLERYRRIPTDEANAFIEEHYTSRHSR